MNYITFFHNHITVTGINLLNFITEKNQKMSEENLKCIPVTDLIDLMVISVNELIILHKKRDYAEYDGKTKELQLIQKVIADKKVPIYN